MKNLLLIMMLVLIAWTGTAQNIPSYVPTNGLVGWWPFNGNANDESGNHNDGTVNGATMTIDRFGNAGKAYSFDGSSGITIPNSSTLVVGNSSTFSFWLKYNNLSNGFNLVFQKGVVGGCPNSGYYFAYDGIPGPIHKCFGYGTPGNCSSISDTSYLDNQWHNIVVVYDRQNSQIYFDGMPQDGDANFNINQSIFNTIDPLILGYYSGPFSGTSWNGLIDDFGIWNRALTQKEITNLYNASTTPPSPCPTLPANLQTGLVGYWPFCGNANDESGNGNNGTVNGATLTSDRFGNAGKAYSFDGVNDFIMVQDNSKLNPSSLTISGWINSNSISSIAEPNALVTKWNQISNCGGDGENYGVYLNVINNKNILYCNTSRNSQFPNSLQTISDLLGFNNWKHFVFTHDSNYGQKLFIDGVQINSNNITGNLCATTNNLYFGADKQNSSLWRFFSGSLDDICIWNRALDSTEISQLYQTQSSDANNGNVGVNVIAPQRNLHVKDVIRLEPRSTPPDNPVFGDMYIDAVLKKLRVYDGTTWQNCW